MRSKKQYNEEYMETAAQSSQKWALKLRRKVPDRIDHEYSVWAVSDLFYAV